MGGQENVASSTSLGVYGVSSRMRGPRTSPAAGAYSTLGFRGSIRDFRGCVIRLDSIRFSWYRPFA
jgi:hypothetical protein